LNVNNEMTLTDKADSYDVVLVICSNPVLMSHRTWQILHIAVHVLASDIGQTLNQDMAVDMSRVYDFLLIGKIAS